MFLEKYLDEFYYRQVIENYEKWYLETIDESNFVKIYNVFSEYGFYYINDIILNCLEIFTSDVQTVKNKISSLRDKLGDNFVDVIGNNMNYLYEITW